MVEVAMQLKRQSEIAISVLAACARQPERKIAGQELADDACTTMGNVYQVVSLLARNGLLKSERGPGGGVRLAVRPEEIRLADVLKITQPDLDRAHAEGDLSPPRGTEVLLDRIVATTSSFFIRLLDRFTVADLVAPETSVRVPCFDCRLMTEGQEPERANPDETGEVRSRQTGERVAAQLQQ